MAGKKQQTMTAEVSAHFASRKSQLDSNRVSSTPNYTLVSFILSSLE